MKRARLRPAAVVLLTAFVAACAASAGPSASVSPAVAPPPSSSPSLASPVATPSPIVAPPASLSPEPPASPSPSPPSALPRAALVDRDDVRVRIVLDRNPLPAGEWTWLTTEVRNLGSTDLTWFHDGCAIPVSVFGRMGVAWNEGQELEGAAQAFKEHVLGQRWRPDAWRAPLVQFVPEALAGRGTFGCADIGISDRIRPGETIRRRMAWDGMAAGRWGPPPNGPVSLTGTFAYYWRGEMPADITNRTIEVALDAWVVGGPKGWLGPAEVVDAAMTDRALVAWLAPQQLGSGRESVLWYVPEERLWWVGLVVWNDRERPWMHYVRVHPATGAVIDMVDRAWHPEADGVP